MKKIHVIVFMILIATGVSVLHAPAALAQAGTTNGCLNGAVDGGDGNCYNMDTSQIVGKVQAPVQTQDSTNSTGGSFTALAPIPGLTDASKTAVVNSTTLANFFNNLYKYMVGLAATLAVIMIIWGGLEISTKDSVSKQSDGKERIYNAIFGLVLVLSPVLVFSIINPAILNLSLNLPALNTTPGTAPTTSGTAMQNTQLSGTDIQLRQSAGVRVLYARAPSVGSMTPIQILQAVNSEQATCTNTDGGPGLLVPVTPLGGGTIQYSCQTCPPNTSVSLFSSCTRGKTGAISCGTCQPN